MCNSEISIWVVDSFFEKAILVVSVDSSIGFWLLFSSWAPLVTSDTTANKKDEADAAQDNNPDHQSAHTWRSWSGCWDERIYTCSEDLVTHISIIETVESQIDLGSLVYVAWVGIVVRENTEHLLEEHATKDHIVRLSFLRVEVGDMDVALRSAAWYFDVCCECCKRNTHVDCLTGCEVEQEIVALKWSVALAWLGHDADSVGWCCTNNSVWWNVSKQINKIWVDCWWKTKTLEVSSEGNWVRGAEWLKVSTGIKSIGVCVNFTKTKLT